MCSKFIFAILKKIKFEIYVSAKQMIYMSFSTFYSKIIIIKIQCHLRQILLGALRLNNSATELGGVSKNFLFSILNAHN